MGYRDKFVIYSHGLSQTRKGKEGTIMSFSSTHGWLDLLNYLQEGLTYQVIPAKRISICLPKEFFK